MNQTINLPNQNILLKNFRNCIDWKEKYLYIIELGNYLSPFPENMKSKKNLIPGCQSKIWIIMKTIYKNKTEQIIQLKGDSDSAITKGILCIIFIIYQGLTIQEVIHYNPYYVLNQLELTEHLTYSRSQGIKLILHTICKNAEKLLFALNK